MSETESQLIVDVPEEAVPEEVTMWVKTGKGTAKSETKFRVMRKPVITSVTPECGFAPASNFPWAGENFFGTRVVIEGKRFAPYSDNVTVGY